MSETKQGVVQSVFGPNDYGFFKIKVDGDWYGMGKSKPDIAKGDTVSFEFYLKDDKYKTVKGKVTKTAQATNSPAGSSGQSSNLSKEEWAQKDVRAARGYAVRDAVAFLTLAQAAGALTFLDKAKGPEKYDLLVAAVSTRAEEFVKFVYGTTPKAEPTEAEKEAAGGDDEEME